jgi:crotonobetainyl-CoA:carnitine CoA-transferase CaiB-like acyl-CoA transferase
LAGRTQPKGEAAGAEAIAGGEVGGRALRGVKVLDFTRQMVAYTTMVLADFGADVIKIESGPRGDPHRASGTAFLNGHSTWFMTWNRGKRSVCMDLRSRQTRATIERLIRQSDVLIHNFTHDVPAHLGIDWETVHAANPRLVYVWINGLGSKGPWRDLPSGDPHLQAMSGLMSITGEPGRPPVLIGVPMISFATAMVAAQAVLLGLLERNSTGEGAYHEVPMLAVALSSLADRLGDYFITNQDPTAEGSQHSGVAPLQVFESADGYVFAGANWRWWESFCELIGLPDLPKDPRFATNVDRLDHRDELIALLAPRFRTRTTSEWERLFADSGIPFAPVNRLSQILESEHVRDNEWIFEMAHPDAGSLRHIAPMIMAGGTRTASSRPAPLLGQHNREVLAEFGFSEAEIRELQRGKVLLADLDDGAARRGGA